MSPVLGRPPRAPRSRPVNPGAKAPGTGKVTTASGKPTGARRATGPDEERRTARGHEACKRGTPPATTKAHGQVPSDNGRRLPQTWRARTTRNETRHGPRGQAKPAAVCPDVCATGSEPSPCRLQNSRRPDGRVRAQRVHSPCRLRNSRRPDGRVRARRVHSPCLLRKAAVWMDLCPPCSEARHTQRSTPGAHTGEQEPSGPGHRTHNTQHDTPSDHTGE